MKPCPYCGHRNPEIDSTAPADSDISASCPKCGNKFIIPANSLQTELPIDPISEDDQIAVVELFAEGRDLLGSKKYDQAVMRLRAASDKDPTRKDILFSLADACSRSNLAYEALSAYLKILTIDPNDEQALFKSGMLYVQQRRHDMGMANLKKLLEVDPGNSQAELMLNIAKGERQNTMKERREAGRRMAVGLNENVEAMDTAQAMERVMAQVSAGGSGNWLILLMWLAPPVAFMGVYATMGASEQVIKPLLIAMLLYSVFFSVVVHELGHGTLAMLMGDDTAQSLGRLTFNPISHVSLTGMLLAPAAVYYLAGVMFGWAKPVPFNPLKLPRYPRGQVVVAGAGPMASLALSYLAFTAFISVAALHNSLNPESQVFFDANLINPIHVGAGIAGSVWFTILELTAITSLVSLIIGVFNLIPIPPLDGSWLLGAILPPSWAVAIRKGFVVGVAIIVAAVYLGWIQYLFYPAFVVLTGYYYIAGLVL